jgi:hypothetical protein
MSEPGSGCDDPAQRSSQPGPETVSVKLEDCGQTLELNVIVKEEEEREIKEEENSDSGEFWLSFPTSADFADIYFIEETCIYYD